MTGSVIGTVYCWQFYEDFSVAS